MSFIKVLPVGAVSQVIDPPGPRAQFTNWTPAQPGREIKQAPAVTTSGRRPRRGRLGVLLSRLRAGIGGGIAAVRLNWDDDRDFVPAGMYTDWTAVILLLLTAAPLAVVVATAAFFIWRQRRQQLR